MPTRRKAAPRKPAPRKPARKPDPPARRRVIVHVRGDRIDVERVNVSAFEVAKILELAWQLVQNSARLADPEPPDEGGT